jgi:hypothetical protein
MSLSNKFFDQIGNGSNKECIVSLFGLWVVDSGQT